MQFKGNMLASLVKVSLCAILALGFVAQIQAQDKKADGTYSWTMQGRQGGPERKITLKLKTEGDKLTGAVSSPGRDGNTMETKIEEGKVKGEEISFSVVREFNGNKMTSKYSGKLTADGIKGKIESTGRDGEVRSRDWEAKRVKEEKAK